MLLHITCVAFRVGLSQTGKSITMGSFMFMLLVVFN